MGNHDYVDPRVPFLRFMDHIDGVRFIIKPTMVEVGGGSYPAHVFLVPHTEDPAASWPKHKRDFSAASLVVFHQMFSGSKLDNGTVLTHGPKPRFLEHCGVRGNTPVLAGDVHVPQNVNDDVGRVLYVGAPHPIAFGDAWQPRALWAEGSESQIEISEILRDVWVKKRSVVLTGIATPRTKLDDKRMRPGDHLKVEIQLRREEFDEWEPLRREVTDWSRENGIHLASVKLTERKGKGRKQKIQRAAPAEQTDVLGAYVKARDVDEDAAEMGRKILKGVQ
jgi:hypothetical protein